MNYPADAEEFAKFEFAEDEIEARAAAMFDAGLPEDELEDPDQERDDLLRIARAEVAYEALQHIVDQQHDADNIPWREAALAMIEEMECVDGCDWDCHKPQDGLWLFTKAFGTLRPKTIAAYGWSFLYQDLLEEKAAAYSIPSEPEALKSMEWAEDAILAKAQLLRIAENGHNDGYGHSDFMRRAHATFALLAFEHGAVLASQPTADKALWQSALGGLIDCLQPLDVAWNEDNLGSDDIRRAFGTYDDLFGDSLSLLCTSEMDLGGSDGVVAPAILASVIDGAIEEAREADPAIGEPALRELLEERLHEAASRFGKLWISGLIDDAVAPATV